MSKKTFLFCLAPLLLDCASSPVSGDVSARDAADAASPVTASADAQAPGAPADGGSDSASSPAEGDAAAPHASDAGATDSSTPKTSSPDAAAPTMGSDAGTTTSADAGLLQGTGKTYYVSPTGSDGNPGSSSSPWLTIQQAGMVVAAGDTVIVRAGTYDAPIFGWDSPPCSGDKYCVVLGTKTNPILFEADPSAPPGSVVIAARNDESATGFDLEPGCDYVNIVGFTMTNAGTGAHAAGSITKAGISVGGSTGNLIVGNTVNGVAGIGGIFVDGVTNVVIQGNTVTNTQGSSTKGHGMYVSGSSVGVKVQNNVIHDNEYVGIHVNGDVSEGLPGVVQSISIVGNLIYANGQNGINADGLQNSTIANNVIYGNARNGIELYQIDAFGGSSGNVIVNNTIDASQTSGGYAISIDSCAYDNQDSQPTPAACATSAADSSTGNIAFNNVLLGNGGAYTDVSSADLSLASNITTSESSLFLSGKYQLAPGGPGIGTGVSSYLNAHAPAAGTGGTGYDIGAFAF